MRLRGLHRRGLLLRCYDERRSGCQSKKEKKRADVRQNHIGTEVTPMLDAWRAACGADPYLIIHSSNDAGVLREITLLNLVTEVTDARKYHGQVEPVRGRDYLLVAHRAAGLDNGRSSCPANLLDSVRKRKKRI